MIELVNRQRKIKINPKIHQEFAAKVIETIEEAHGKSMTIAFVSDKQMRELNRQFRGKDSTTDVLSFPHESDEFASLDSCAADNIGIAYLGDVVISVEQARRQAAENNLTLELEISQLILHGILHLCGYDHASDAGEMNVIELELRDKLGI